jgi:hypothetical protein
MRLDELAAKIGAKVVVGSTASDKAAVDISSVYAGDRVSDLLNHAGRGVLLVSNLVGSHLVCLAQLLDVPGICLLNDIIPEPEAVKAALDNGTVLMVSPLGMYETCGRLYKALAG